MNANQFASLTVRKRRILLAKDVLANLKAKKFIETRGSYLNLVDVNGWQNNYAIDSDDSKAFQAFIKQDTTKCEVCAKGAVICAYADKYNSVTRNQAAWGDVAKIRRLMGADFWDTLEILFEGWNRSEVDSDEGRRYDLVVKYNPQGRKYALKTLMQNIIDNRGLLKIQGKVIH